MTETIEDVREQLAAATAERDRLRKLFDDAGEGAYDVLALIDHYQRSSMEADERLRELRAELAQRVTVEAPAPSETEDLGWGWIDCHESGCRGPFPSREAAIEDARQHPDCWVDDDDTGEAFIDVGRFVRVIPVERADVDELVAGIVAVMNQALLDSIQIEEEQADARVLDGAAEGLREWGRRFVRSDLQTINELETVKVRGASMAVIDDG